MYHWGITNVAHSSHYLSPFTQTKKCSILWQQKAARHDWKLLQAWRRDASLQAVF